jgi:hypothetical protein
MGTTIRVTSKREEGHTPQENRRPSRSSPDCESGQYSCMGLFLPQNMQPSEQRPPTALVSIIGEEAPRGRASRVNAGLHLSASTVLPRQLLTRAQRWHEVPKKPWKRMLKPTNFGGEVSSDPPNPRAAPSLLFQHSKYSRTAERLCPAGVWSPLRRGDEAPVSGLLQLNFFHSHGSSRTCALYTTQALRPLRGLPQLFAVRITVPSLTIPRACSRPLQGFLLPGWPTSGRERLARVCWLFSWGRRWRGSTKTRPILKVLAYPDDCQWRLSAVQESPSVAQPGLAFMAPFSRGNLQEDTSIGRTGVQPGPPSASTHAVRRVDPDSYFAMSPQCALGGAGGSRYVSTHSLLHPIPPYARAEDEKLPVMEWHFHVYWHQLALDVGVNVGPSPGFRFV